jgi:hypothetical protein
MSILITCFILFLMLLAIFLIWYSIFEGEFAGFVLAIGLIAVSLLISGVGEAKVDTIIKPFSAEMAHHVLYVRVEDTVQSFNKLEDIERFKDKKETEVQLAYNVWGGLVSITIIPPSSEK